MDFEARVRRLETRLERDYRHLENVISTQREIVQKAFDQVSLAMLEQQMAIRVYAESTKEGLGELLEHLTETNSELQSIKERLNRLENPPAA